MWIAVATELYAMFLYRTTRGPVWQQWGCVAFAATATMPADRRWATHCSQWIVVSAALVILGTILRLWCVPDAVRSTTRFDDELMNEQVLSCSRAPFHFSSHHSTKAQAYHARAICLGSAPFLLEWTDLSPRCLAPLPCP